MTMKIIISEFMDKAALDAARQAEIVYDPKLVDDRPRLLEAVAKADALIVRNRTQVDAELLEAAPNLRVIGRLGVGLDNIDMDICTQRGVMVRPARGANSASVAEYVIWAALTLLRPAHAAHAPTLAGSWPRAALGEGREIGGRMLGLYGFGEIARDVARRATALGMLVVAHDPFTDAEAFQTAGVTSVSPEELLAHADILSLHLPLTDMTRRLIDASALAAMKHGAVLINTARGGVVDEPALVAALKAGALGGAALDVFTEEPLTSEAGAAFKDAPNLILTPHIAGVTADSNARVSMATMANVLEELSK